MSAQEIMDLLTERLRHHPEFDLDKLDKAAIQKHLDATAAEWTLEIWDHQSPINGVDAQIVSERNQLKAADGVFLLKQGDRTVIFQPHKPKVNGIERMNEQEAREIGAQMLKEIIFEQTVEKIIPQIRR